MAATEEIRACLASPKLPPFPPPPLNIPDGLDRAPPSSLQQQPYELSSLSPSRVLPPTPLGYFQLSSIAAPPGLLNDVASPKYLQELWCDFDRVGGGVHGALGEGVDGGSDHHGCPPTVAALHLPPLGTWRSTTSAKPMMIEQQCEEDVKEEAASGHISSRKRRAAPSRGKAALPPSRRPRGAYRCRKCGGPKRAHDCPFACRQRSAGTQTNLAITGNDGSDREGEDEEDGDEDDGMSDDGASDEEEEDDER